MRTLLLSLACASLCSGCGLLALSSSAAQPDLGVRSQLDAGEVDAQPSQDAGSAMDADSAMDSGSSMDASSAVDGSSPDQEPPPADAGLPDDWWDSAFSARRLVRLVNTSTESFVDFPVLVRVSDGCMDLASLRPDRGDLRFLMEGGTDALSYEVDTSSADELLVWVKVPLVAADDETRLWLYHANPDAASAEDSAAVWSNGYRAVWHLGGAPGSAELVDSTAYGNNAVIADSLPLVAGVVGAGRLFLNDVVEVPHHDSLEMSAVQELTLEGWAQPSIVEEENRYMIRKLLAYQLAAMRPYTDAFSPEMVLWFDLGHETNHAGVAANAPLSTSELTYVVSTYALSDHTMRIYLNGALANQETPGDAHEPWTLRESTEILLLGDHYNGQLDELRVSALRRSDAWIQAQHEVMAGSFVTLGPCESWP